MKQSDCDVVDLTEIYDYPVTTPMARWQDMLNVAQPRRRTTKVSRNGTVVLAATARRAAGIEPGDEVVTIPVGPGHVLVERVGFSTPDGRTWGDFLRSEDNPFRGLWGDDPQAYVDELRGPWPDDTRS
jgi:bifunctional DNA-binding transcriptional regulator/antitoxin component of YhaV-PrlF toxin-antitoxin module